MNETTNLIIDDSRGLSAETLYAFQHITSNQLSPDGRHVVYAVQRIERKAEKRYQDIWVVAADGESAPRQFTSGNSTDSAPAWSPDGRTIAFTSNRDDEKQSQLYLLPFDGGEARPLTDVKGGIGQFAWSADGTQIAFCLTEPDAREREMLDDEAQKKLGIVAYHVKTTQYKADGAGFLPDAYQHIWVVDVASGEATQMTTGDFHAGSLAWSPDGGRLAFVANLHPDADLHEEAAQLYTIATDTTATPYEAAAFTQLTTHPGALFAPQYAPDGRTIAFYGTRDDSGYYQNMRLFTMPANGGTVTDATAGNDVYVGSNTLGDIGGLLPSAPILWSDDGRFLYAQISKHGQQPLVRFDLDSGGMETVLGGVIGQFGIADGRIAFVRSSLYSPGDLFAVNDGRERQLTDLHAWMGEHKWGNVEEMWFDAADGYRLQGWIMTPPDFDASQQYPTIIEVHGGPQSQYGAHFMHEFHYLATQGYVVAFSNPRGGQGYGEAHCKAIFGRWGSVDVDDVMTFTDVIAQLPYVDETRMGATGGSYGGLMMAWLIGRTDRFKATVAQRIVFNWTSMYGSCDFNHGSVKLTGAPTPWEDIETNWQQSPFSQIANAVTPTLVIHSINDYRTNLEQGEQLFVALRKLGVPTEMVLFPGESHGLSRAGRTDRRVVRLRHILRWFNKYI